MWTAKKSLTEINLREEEEVALTKEEEISCLTSFCSGHFSCFACTHINELKWLSLDTSLSCAIASVLPLSVFFLSLSKLCFEKRARARLALQRASNFNHHCLSCDFCAVVNCKIFLLVRAKLFLFLVFFFFFYSYLKNRLGWEEFIDKKTFEVITRHDVNQMFTWSWQRLWSRSFPFKFRFALRSCQVYLRNEIITKVQYLSNPLIAFRSSSTTFSRVFGLCIINCVLIKFLENVLSNNSIRSFTIAAWLNRHVHLDRNGKFPLDSQCFCTFSSYYPGAFLN